MCLKLNLNLNQKFSNAESKQSRSCEWRFKYSDKRITHHLLRTIRSQNVRFVFGRSNVRRNFMNAYFHGNYFWDFLFIQFFFVFQFLFILLSLIFFLRRMIKTENDFSIWFIRFFGIIISIFISVSTISEQEKNEFLFERPQPKITKENFKFVASFKIQKMPFRNYIQWDPLIA